MTGWGRVPILLPTAYIQHGGLSHRAQEPLTEPAPSFFPRKSLIPIIANTTKNMCFMIPVPCDGASTLIIEKSSVVVDHCHVQLSLNHTA